MTKVVDHVFIHFFLRGACGQGTLEVFCEKCKFLAVSPVPPSPPKKKKPVKSDSGKN